MGFPFCRLKKLFFQKLNLFDKSRMPHVPRKKITAARPAFPDFFPNSSPFSLLWRYGAMFFDDI